MPCYPNFGSCLSAIMMTSMRVASIGEVTNRLTEYIAESRISKEPIVITRHGRPYALIHALTKDDVDRFLWMEMAKRNLSNAWQGEEDALYDYL